MSKRILYLDPFSGLSGDMFVAALLDLGLDLARLHHELGKLKVSGWQLNARRVLRGGISATKFDVSIHGEVETAYDAAESDFKNAVDHGHSHGDHSHSHSHAGEHSHGATGDAPHRNFQEIRELIAASALSERAKRDSLRVFEKLAQAEGRVHGMAPDDVAFHEVGALDSIIDIVGACAGLELLGIEEVWCGPVALGSGGTIRCDHGLIPVPAPATLELAKGFPIRATPIEKELTTPTGAALAAALAANFGALPALQVEKIGYGAGAREKQPVPNVLRALIGNLSIPAQNTETADSVVEIQTQIDNATAETLGYLAERLMQAGALDVFFVPAQMKKFRPGTLLTVLGEPGRFDELARIIFQESSTFGLRYQTLSRLKLAREFRTVATEFGEVRVKIGRWNGLTTIHPEHDDCRALAAQKNVALQSVVDAARAAAQKTLNG